jgi:hypothetical protein
MFSALGLPNLRMNKEHYDINSRSVPVSSNDIDGLDTSFTCHLNYAQTHHAVGPVLDDPVAYNTIR